MRKPCIICGNLTTTGSRCETHQAEKNHADQQRKNTPERLAKKRELYGPYYRRQRKAILSTATNCAICGRPFQPGDKIETDHIFPGDPLSPLQPAHRICNQRKSDKR